MGTTLNSSTTVTKGHTYALTGKPSTTGTQDLRVSTSGATHSPALAVKVS
ncbi:hypothetical protein [Streptomyces sp. WELS2]|nr:hypothetical protein [Streptomyces sp. WELS2]